MLAPTTPLPTVEARGVSTLADRVAVGFGGLAVVSDLLSRLLVRRVQDLGIVMGLLWLLFAGISLWVSHRMSRGVVRVEADGLALGCEDGWVRVPFHELAAIARPRLAGGDVSLERLVFRLRDGRRLSVYTAGIPPAALATALAAVRDRAPYAEFGPELAPSPVPTS